MRGKYSQKNEVLKEENRRCSNRARISVFEKIKPFYTIRLYLCTVDGSWMLG